MSIPSHRAPPCVDAAESGDSGPQIRLDRFVDDVERLGTSSLRTWRGAALRGLTDVRQVLVDESAASDWHDERGTLLLRERTVLLDRISLLRLHVLGVEEVDRISYDVRRLVADVRTHLDHLPEAPACRAAAGVEGDRTGSEWRHTDQ
ncbi:hypothetical protein [Nocardioides gilvus]|uniref:hypothetical protein n=1 Tax=Nocardioides gilvus TaxID=1735589 RepID=UPI0013A5B48D|nr:hypothetical protein [Nocardioides gilvus]